MSTSEPKELDSRDIASNLARLRRRIATAAERAGRDAAGIRLVAISKNASPEQLREAYAAGQREFGESRVQDALPRLEALPTDVVWHLVGHLQSNKVNKVIGRFELIHSVDSLPLAERLALKSAEREFPCSVLVQVNCSGEASKTGVTPEEARDLVLALRELPGLVTRGLMTIAPRDGGAEGARESFRRLAEIFAELRDLDLPELPLELLSMGMSEDFEIAVEEGANLLRVGRAVFATES